MDKKKRERREKKIAEQKENARSDSESRQERIKILWDLEKKLEPSKKTYVLWDLVEKKFKPSKTYVQKELKREKLEKLLHLFSDVPSNDELISLVELVVLQDQEIEYLEQFRRKWERIEAYAPEQLDYLSNPSLFAELRPYLESQLSKEKPKQAWERKRRRDKLPSGVGRIEYQFGGPADADSQKQSLSGVVGLPYEPTCLDDIFVGGEVRMRSEGHKAGLEELFGMDSKRFGRGLPSIKKGREVWYDYHAVVKIMHRLLSEKPLESKGPKRGKARLWPGDRGQGMLGPNGIVALRVLTEIVARSDRLAVSDEIRDAFTAVVCHHIAQGMDLPLTEDVKNWIAALVRRHLG